MRKHMPSLLEKMLSHPFAERSDRGNAKHFRGSARPLAAPPKKLKMQIPSEATEKKRSIFEALPVPLPHPQKLRKEEVKNG